MEAPGCVFKFKKPTQKGRRVISKSLMMVPSDHACSDALGDKVFGSMAPDSVTLVAKKDPLIVAYGEKLFWKHGNLHHKIPYIRQEICELSRFLIAAREEESTSKEGSAGSGISDLQSCIDSSKFLQVIGAVKKLCGYMPVSNSYKNPSLAQKLGHSLKKCSLALKAHA